jgi:adenosylmethionine-8-amino-7-oxononanoate aminotransferase
MLEGLRRFVDHPLVGEVKGVGMIAGVELVKMLWGRRRGCAIIGAADIDRWSFARCVNRTT